MLFTTTMLMSYLGITGVTQLLLQLLPSLWMLMLHTVFGRGAMAGTAHDATSLCRNGLEYAGHNTVAVPLASPSPLLFEKAIVEPPPIPRQRSPLTVEFSLLSELEEQRQRRTIGMQQRRSNSLDTLLEAVRLPTPTNVFMQSALPSARCTLAVRLNGRRECSLPPPVSELMHPSEKDGPAMLPRTLNVDIPTIAKRKIVSLPF